MGKILVVDDEADILEILQDLLEEEGHNVVTFENPKEAIEHLKTTS
jgi:CheY-like chemotaxis protein